MIKTRLKLQDKRSKMVGSKLTEEIMQLPIDFINRMKIKLGEEYEVFLRSYEEERAYGLRYNPLKIVGKILKR